MNEVLFGQAQMQANTLRKTSRGGNNFSTNVSIKHAEHIEKHRSYLV